MFKLEVQYGFDVFVFGFWFTFRTVKDVDESELSVKLDALLPKRWGIFRRVEVSRVS